MDYHIYPSVVSSNRSWENQIKEVKELNLKEICLFPTCLPKKKRYSLYQQFAKIGVQEIPLLHLRHDMDEAELNHLTRLFIIKFFNLHSQLHSRFPLEHNLAKYKNQILMENTLSPLLEEGKDYTGLCPDFSHLESQRLKKTELYPEWIKSFKKYPLKAAHLSAVKKQVFKQPGYGLIYDAHSFSSLQEFDYLKRYRQYFPKICALELENSIAEQLQAKEYIHKIVSQVS